MIIMIKGEKGKVTYLVILLTVHGFFRGNFTIKRDYNM